MGALAAHALVDTNSSFIPIRLFAESPCLVADIHGNGQVVPGITTDFSNEVAKSLQTTT